MATPARAVRTDASIESPQSAVSWGAIFVGAAGAAALSLLLVILGFGLGLSAVSPWNGAGATAGTIGIATVIWLAFTQFASAGVGGFLAGRLRVKWSALHTDEVFFRDTAHGFIAWAVATLVVVAFLSSAVTSVLETGTKAAGSLVGAAAGTAAAGTAAAAASPEGSSAMDYFTDRLYRKAPGTAASTPTPATAASNGQSSSHAEAARILATSLKNGQLSDEDRDYLASTVAQETGIPQAEASARVTDGFNKAKAAADNAANTAKQAADDARKAAAHGALWSFVALLIGAFIASFAATMGGRHRDLHD